MKLLLIEDEQSVADYICRELQREGSECEHFADGALGLERALQGGFDAMVIDRMLPSTDGLTVVGEVRRRGDQTPILLLSALGEVEDRVDGLHAGADDYLVKPFSMEELSARLQALCRRRGQSSAPVETSLQVGQLQIDLLKQEVCREGLEISLQPREYKLLEFLMRNAGQVVTRKMLLEHVWGYHFDPQTNVIDVHISRLRQKLDKGFDVPMLTTVRGAGYRLQEA
jgi:two-component system OmpR family response regulator